VTKESDLASAVLISLPRPQRPLPPRNTEKNKFASVEELVADAWKGDDDSPEFAWIQYSLSAGMPLDDFMKAFQELSAIKYAFGRRAFVHPVRMDHHEIELPDVSHMVNADSGQHEIEVAWRKKRCDGGSHILFAVGSTKGEDRQSNPAGLDALEALESLIRVTLGAMTVVQTRRAFHANLVTRKSNAPSEVIHTYGAAELPRSNKESLAAAIELAERSGNIPSAIAGRVALGLRWANQAFKGHDLLAFWTAIEILAGRRGHAVYPILALAYGKKTSDGQKFAQSLGLDVISDLRGKLAHTGRPIHMESAGASYLNAIAHDLARHAAGLSCLEFALRALGDRRVNEWFVPHKE
jgi:hypothetical protein